MRRASRCLALLAITAASCGGVRYAARPTTHAGYRAVEIRDIAPTGMKEVNVKLDGTVWAVDGDDNCGLVTILLMSGGMPTLDQLRLPDDGSVTLTLPRSRYREVRDLHRLDRVRVRGYLSNWVAEGCNGTGTAGTTFMWVDTIEPLGQEGDGSPKP